jgi:hypothetical protein
MTGAHSEAAIGRVWSPEDHASLLAHLRKIDETVVAMHEKKRPQSPMDGSGALIQTEAFQPATAGFAP